MHEPLKATDINQSDHSKRLALLFVGRLDRGLALLVLFVQMLLYCYAFPCFGCLFAYCPSLLLNWGLLFHLFPPINILLRQRIVFEAKEKAAPRLSLYKVVF